MNNTCRSHSDLLPSEAQAEDKERFTGTDYIYLGGHKLCWIHVFVKVWKLFILGEFLLGDVDLSKMCTALSIKTSSVKRNILDSARRNPAVLNCVSGGFCTRSRAPLPKSHSMLFKDESSKQMNGLAECSQKVLGSEWHRQKWRCFHERMLYQKVCDLKSLHDWC